MPLTIRSAFFAMPAILLSGCSSEPNSTMSILRSGSSKICVASDVKSSLRKLLLPDALDKDYTVTFDEVTLESFDKQVAKASCHAYLTVIGPTHPLIDRSAFDFTIAPAAQHPDDFIVTAAVDPLRSQIEEDAARRAADERTSENERRSADELSALVKPGWLLGRWVDASAGSETCTTGPFFEFLRNGALKMGPQAGGRWTLKGTYLTITGPAKSLSYSITSADSDTFTITTDTSDDGGIRRCAQEEVQVAIPSEPPSEAAKSTSSPDSPNNGLPSIVTQ